MSAVNHPWSGTGRNRRHRFVRPIRNPLQTCQFFSLASRLWQNRRPQRTTPECHRYIRPRFIHRYTETIDQTSYLRFATIFPDFIGIYRASDLVSISFTYLRYLNLANWIYRFDQFFYCNDHSI